MATMPNSNIPVPEGYDVGDEIASNIPIPKGEVAPKGWKAADPQPDLPDLPGSSSRPLYTKNPPKNYLKEQLKALPGDLLSMADLVGSIPAGLVGTAAGAGFAISEAAKGHSTKQQAEMANLAFTESMDAYGSPFSKLLKLAGLGRSENDPTSNVDAIMQRATTLVGKGGEWLDDKTGGAIPKAETEFLVNGVMSLGGGKGLKVGMEKLAARASKPLLGAVTSTPEAEARLQRLQAQQSEEPLAAPKMAEENLEKTQEAVQAKVVKTRLEDPKALVLDPVTGDLHEAIPEPGKPLPKPSTIDSALDKAAGGRLFDLTAEERIALKGMKEAPLEQPIVDEQGNIIRAGGKLNKEAGSISPELMARLAGLGLGAWAGMYFSDEHDLTHALLGAAGGAMLAKAKPIVFAKAVRAALSKEAPRYRIKGESRDWETYTRQWQVDAILLQNDMDKIVPKLKDREAVGAARESLKRDPQAISRLSAAQQRYAKILADATDVAAVHGISEDVLHSYRENYLTHLLDWSGNKKSMVDAFMRQNFGEGMSPKTRFAKERTYDSVEDLEKAGFKVISKDPTYLIGVHFNSMFRAIANKHLLEDIKARTTTSIGANGPVRPINFILPADKAPHQYVSIRHPLLNGMRVHPDLEGQLKLLFDTSNPGAWMKAASGVSDIVKRSEISGSIFHAKSLVEAGVRGSSHPLKYLASVPGMLAGTNQFLTELKKGSASSLVMRSIKAGLKYEVERKGAGGTGSEDAGAGFYGAMQSASRFADSVIPHTGAPIRGAVAVSKVIDTLLWPRLHTATKLFLFDEKARQLMANSLREEKAGRGKALTQDQADDMAAAWTNDVEGGQNYLRIAMEAQSKFGRQLAEGLFDASGRRGLQLAEFAPDWNISAIRVIVGAIGDHPLEDAMHPVRTIRGVLRPKDYTDLHRQLVAKSALYYFIALNAINLSMSGHPIWQNKDWTKIDMDPKGERHLQIDKGMMEVPNMVRQPVREFFNKLGFLPSEALDQTFGAEYMDPRVNKKTGKVEAGPTMKESRPEHVAKRLLPFSAQERPTKGPAESAAATIGLIQITGSTPESRAKQRREDKLRREKLKRESKK